MKIALLPVKGPKFVEDCSILDVLFEEDKGISITLVEAVKDLSIGIILVEG